MTMTATKRALAIKTSATRLFPAMAERYFRVEFTLLKQKECVDATIQMAEQLIDTLEKKYNIDWEKL